MPEKEKINTLCVDCQEEILIENQEIKNGVCLVYDYNGEKIKVLKCHSCFKKNPQLSNFQRCEVYSRIVGYLRPVQHWNKGKQEEFEERKEFNI